MSQAAESVRSLYPERGKRLQVDIPLAPIYIEGDATWLMPVVSTLLTKGARHTNEQGKVELRLMHKGEKATLQMRDNGIGLGSALGCI